jgi:DNA-binding NarL/FixJ family response regulator
MVSMNGRAPHAAGKLGVLLAIFEFPTLTAGLRSIIDGELDMWVVDVVEREESLAEALATSKADVVITECLPFTRQACTSFQAIEAIRAAHPAIRILTIECRASGDQFSLALKAGADGYLTREAEPGDVVSAIRCVGRGETYVSPAIVTRMVNTYVLRAPGNPLEDAYDTLTDREREVLLLAAVGHTNREIAQVFHLSEQTVHNYRATVMEKLGFHDRVELLKYAIRRGLVNVADL